MDKKAILELRPSSLKLTIFQVNDEKFFSVLDIFSLPLKLGDSLNVEGIITPQQMKDSLVIIGEMQDMIFKNSIKTVQCVVSPDFALTSNFLGFLNEIKEKNALSFKCLSLEEQIKALHTSVTDSVDLPRGIMVSLEENKLMIIQYTRKNVISSNVFECGVQPMMKKVEGKTIEESRIIIKNFIESEIERTEFSLMTSNNDIEVIGLNSYFTSVGRLMRKTSKYPFSKSHNYQAKASTFKEFAEMIYALNIDEKTKLKGIDQENSKQFAVGLMIIDALFEKFANKSFIVCEKGITNGLILSLSEELSRRTNSDILEASIAKNKSLYWPKSQNSDFVARLAISMFSHMKVTYKLAKSYQKPLRVAAEFYDVGKRISYHDLPRNGFNVILGMDLDGISHRDQVLAAFVCLAQDPDEFDLATWLRFQQMFLPEDLPSVKKLGMIIAIASKLDCRKNRVVKSVSFELLGESLIFKAEPEGKAESTQYELNEVSKLIPDFKKIFKSVPHFM